MQKPYISSLFKTKVAKMNTLFLTKMLKNHALWGHTYLYRPCKGLPLQESKWVNELSFKQASCWLNRFPQIMDLRRLHSTGAKQKRKYWLPTPRGHSKNFQSDRREAVKPNNPQSEGNGYFLEQHIGSFGWSCQTLKYLMFYKPVGLSVWDLLKDILGYF